MCILRFTYTRRDKDSRMPRLFQRRSETEKRGVGIKANPSQSGGVETLPLPTEKQRTHENDL